MGDRKQVAGRMEILAFYTAIMRGEVRDWAMDGKGRDAAAVEIPVGLKARVEAADKMNRYYENRGQSRKDKAASEVMRLMKEMDV